MSKANLERWHAHLRGEVEGGLDSLLAEDVVFYSPVVFTPQRGKAITHLYLSAAAETFGGGSDGDGQGANDQAGGRQGADHQSADGKTSGGSTLGPKFRYTRELLSGNCAMLEFETEIGGKYVNGVDLITWNDAGEIIEFKVWLRPLQAVNIVHAKMMAMLEQMS